MNQEQSQYVAHLYNMTKYMQEARESIRAQGPNYIFARTLVQVLREDIELLATLAEAITEEV
jgi:NAD-dependent oxidoreductase involved in siderophore biosynthesis